MQVLAVFTGLDWGVVGVYFALVIAVGVAVARKEAGEGEFFLGGRSVIPQIEPMEAQYPFIIRKSQLLADSGGKGEWRGGLGMETEVELLDEAMVTVRGARMEQSPPGTNGGEPGMAGSWFIRRADGTEEELAVRQADVPIHKGDTFVVRTITVPAIAALVGVVQLIVLLAALLLAIPTRASRRAARSRSRIVGREPSEPIVLPRRRIADHHDDQAAPRTAEFDDTAEESAEAAPVGEHKDEAEVTR